MRWACLQSKQRYGETGRTIEISDGGEVGIYSECGDSMYVFSIRVAVVLANELVVRVLGHELLFPRGLLFPCTVVTESCRANFDYRRSIRKLGVIALGAEL
jgi:hypothetical protein